MRTEDADRGGGIQNTANIFEKLLERGVRGTPSPIPDSYSHKTPVLKVLRDLCCAAAGSRSLLDTSCLRTRVRPKIVATHIRGATVSAASLLARQPSQREMAYMSGWGGSSSINRRTALIAAVSGPHRQHALCVSRLIALALCLLHSLSSCTHVHQTGILLFSPFSWTPRLFACVSIVQIYRTNP